MTEQQPMLRLLFLGVGPRLVAAAVVVALLWLGFFWATAG